MVLFASALPYADRVAVYLIIVRLKHIGIRLDTFQIRYHLLNLVVSQPSLLELEANRETSFPAQYGWQAWLPQLSPAIMYCYIHHQYPHIFQHSVYIPFTWA